MDNDNKPAKAEKAPSRWKEKLRRVWRASRPLVLAFSLLLNAVFLALLAIGSARGSSASSSVSNANGSSGVSGAYDPLDPSYSLASWAEMDGVVSRYDYEASFNSSFDSYQGYGYSGLRFAVVESASWDLNRSSVLGLDWSKWSALGENSSPAVALFLYKLKIGSYEVYFASAFANPTAVSSFSSSQVSFKFVYNLSSNASDQAGSLGLYPSDSLGVSLTGGFFSPAPFYPSVSGVPQLMGPYSEAFRAVQGDFLGSNGSCRYSQTIAHLYEGSSTYAPFCMPYAYLTGPLEDGYPQYSYRRNASFIANTNTIMDLYPLDHFYFVSSYTSSLENWAFLGGSSLVCPNTKSSGVSILSDVSLRFSYVLNPLSLYECGYQAGASASASDNYNSGFKAGYQVGLSESWQKGYDDAIADMARTDDVIDAIDLIGSGIGSFVDLLNMNIFGGITLGTLLAIPLVGTLLFWFIRLLMK